MDVDTVGATHEGAAGDQADSAFAEPAWYTIRLACHLDAAWAAWFEGLSVTNLPGGEAVIAGPIADQAALHGILAKIRDLNLPLIGMARVGGTQCH